MKKSLMALAVLGAMSSVATAQSSVTLYGIVDVGVQWNEQGVAQTGNTTQPYKQDSTFGVNSGYQSGSRFGLRGSEALGSNWNAVFTLEGGYDVDTGMSGQGGRLFGRQAWAGLQHSAFGTFVLGRVATVSSGTGSFDLFASGAGIDPFSTGWGINGLNSTFIPSAALREDNSILWAVATLGRVPVRRQLLVQHQRPGTYAERQQHQGHDPGRQLDVGPVVPRGHVRRDLPRRIRRPPVPTTRR